jgi:putative transposase
VKQNNISEQQSLKELSDFINSNPDPRELKPAMSVMMWIEGVPCSDIQKILNVSATFVSQVKMKFIQHGVKELKLRYQGSEAYLAG